MIVLTPQAMTSVGEMAFHCDQDKLNVAVNEAVLFDMPKLFGRLWPIIEANWLSQDEAWEDLIDGSTFECGGRDRRHRGVKEVLKYFAYSRYIVLNGFNDTPNGHVTKTNQWSVPKSLKELEMFSVKYRNMGKQLFEDVEAYLCVNRGNYPEFSTDNCEHCGCYDSNKRINTRGYGLKSKTIRKWNG